MCVSNTRTMPWRGAPNIDFDQQPEYRWPLCKVDADEEDLFGDLHERFNTAPMFIQDPDAFHKDVSKAEHCASSKADFYDRLQQE